MEIMEIWKYEVFPGGFNLEIPEGAQILTVQVQGSKIYLWAIVDPEKDKELRSFVVHGTGEPIVGIKEKNYIGTFQLHYGFLVYHLFEVKEQK
jgi:hypothetical protein